MFAGRTYYPGRELAREMDLYYVLLFGEQNMICQH